MLILAVAAFVAHTLTFPLAVTVASGSTCHNVS